MKVEYVKPFVQAAYDVLADIFEVPLERGKLSLLTSPVSVNGVAVVIGLTGEIEGRVLFDMTEETAKKIAGVMNYEEFSEMNQLAKATISELGNIIAGRAISTLNDNGFKFAITPPILFIGEKMETTDRSQETLVVPLKSEYGDFNINIALKNGKH